ncbi:MAG: hypothetical protein C4308_07715 [Chitinophagaceae bacterium]
MKKLPPNISSVVLKVFFVVCICLIAVCGQAQYDSVVIDTVDTVSANEPEVEYNYDLVDSFQFRTLKEKAVKAYKKQDDFWYADSAFNQNLKANNANTNSEERVRPIKRSRWLNMTALVIIMTLFLGLVIFFLIKNNVVTKRRVAEQQETDVAEAENIFDIPYETEITKAVQEKNYRLAIRLLFLQLLTTMNEKKIIQYKPEHTNFDYLSQVFSSGYYKTFFGLTRHYEYAWYGKFDVPEESFYKIKTEFENFRKQLP